MKFKDLAKYLGRLEKASSRIKITNILVELFKKTPKDEIDKTVNLLLGQLAPSYKGVVFNIAERMMVRILAQAYDKEPKKVRELYKKKGDLGNVAQSLAKGKEKNLTVKKVYEELHEIAEEQGGGSQERKIEKTAKLLSDLDPLSARFAARIPVGKLRLGFSDKTVIDALSVMERGDKSAKKDLERAYYVMPNVGFLAEKVKNLGIKKATQRSKPKVGVPVLPMLAQRLKSPTEMVEKMGKVAVEPKLDGLRLQIHYKSGKNGFVKAYTRNLNETSWMFPELKNLGKYVKAKQAIIDTEAVGLDEKREKIASFQVTMTRRRKHEIREMSEKVPIFFYVFDILLKGKKGLMKQPYIKRRGVLEKTIKEGEFIKIVDYKVTKSPKEIAQLNKKERKRGREGILVKRADSLYVPGRTGWRWVKMKEAEEDLGKLADTVDGVVMGYSVGRGRRAEFGIGKFLVGVLDKEKIKTVTKVGTGLTDVQLEKLKKRLSGIETKDKSKEYKVNKNLEPDFWVEPKIVVEVAADEITKSPTHSSGYALRFPKLVKFRDDKSFKNATAISEIKKLFEMQKS